MATYLAITQATADWILSKPTLLDAISDLITAPTEMMSLVSSEVVEGPVRLAASKHPAVAAIWNIDYLTGTGEESWGFILLDDISGLRAAPEIQREVLERCIYVINQRLQGLFIEGSLIHRSHPNGAHTCIAGRGTAPRQMNIAYFEKSSGDTAAQHAIVCVGPAHDFAALTQIAAQHSAQIDTLLAAAHSLLAPSRKRTVAEPGLLPGFRRAVASFSMARARETDNEYRDVEITTEGHAIDDRDAFKTFGFSYRDWIDERSPLSDIQRKILFSSAVERHPLRIVGPGGSGKTLLMQLLALRRLVLAREGTRALRVLYIVHNEAMAQMVQNRFNVLIGDDNLVDGDRVLDIVTLAEYGRRQLNLDLSAIIDPDAHEAKQFQLEQVTDALRHAMSLRQDVVNSSRLFAEVQRNHELMPVIARLVMAEISTAIKGHGLEGDRKRYVLSERRLSRFHGILTFDERDLLYTTYELYHQAVFEGFEVLDTDDIALSLLGRLRTPIWELKRKKLGYDFVFVDETQLFNENERRVLPLLTNGSLPHIPIVLALDEAQDIYGQSIAGMATLGIPDIANESLASIHRSTRSIVRLAFFVIQRSTDLFGPDFPDFTGIAEHMEPDTHPLASEPIIEISGQDTRYMKFIVKRIRELRRNLRRIAVICHADQYWDPLLDELRGTDLPLHVLLQRGERIPADQPVVVLSRPAFVGGQEFDAVVLVGLEQGLVPPRVPDNDALATAVEQQSLREMYLSITRARYRLIVALPYGVTPTAVLQDAQQAGLMAAKQSQLRLFESRDA